MKKFDLLVIGFVLLMFSTFGVYGLLYAIQTGNEAIAWWGLVGFAIVGIGAFVFSWLMQRRVNSIQQRLDLVLSERDVIQQRLDLVLSECDVIRQRLDLVLSERDELQQQFYQVLPERDGLQKRLDYVRLIEGLSDKEQVVLYLSKQDSTLRQIEQMTGIPDRTISDIKKSLRGKGLLS